MKSPILARSLFSLKFAAALACLAAVLPAATAHAKDDGVVRYSPTIKLVEGDMPVQESYTLEIIAPTTLTGPATVTLNLLQQGRPAGLSEAAALGFITISPSVVTFNDALDTKTVTVTANVPQGFWTGEYVYQIKTSGWPTDIAYVDDGAFLNMTVAPGSGSTAQPPVVTIDDPLNQTLLTVDAVDFPLTVNFHLTATTADGTPIDSLVADVGGSEVTFTTLTGLGTGNVTATGSFQVFDEGDYSLNATASNEVGSNTDTAEITVRARTQPPTVSINEPGPGLVIEVLSGGSTSQNFSFTGVSQSGTVTALTATLNGTPIDFTAEGLGTPTATGSATLTFTASGVYNIRVTATDQFGTAVDDESVTVVIVLPPDPPGLPPVVAINQPANGANFPVAYGASNTTVAFKFTGTSLLLGGPINQLTATLNGNPISFATNGLGTLSANGTANLTVAPGNYSIVVTARNSFGSTSATGNFTVTRGSSPPPTVVINTPANGATFTLGNCGLTIPFKFTGSSTGTAITNITAKINGNTISLSRSGLGTQTAVGTSNLCLSSPGTYTIVVTATNSVGTATATSTFTVTVPATLKTAICTPTDGATYTLSSNNCSSLSIPFSFTANTTASGGVKTLSAKMNGSSLSFCPDGLGRSSAKGSTTLKISNPGTYTLSVTATDKYGSSTTTYTITVLAPQVKPNVSISDPDNGDTYTYVSGSAALCIPLKVSGNISSGSLSALTATLNGSNVSLSTSGLGGKNASGSATLRINAGGNYTVTAKVVSAAGVSATTSVTFKVSQVNCPAPPSSYSGYDDYRNWSDLIKALAALSKDAPPPYCVNVLSPSRLCDEYQRDSSTLNIKFSLKCNLYDSWKGWGDYFSRYGEDYAGCDRSYRKGWSDFSSWSRYSSFLYGDGKDRWDDRDAGDCKVDTSVQVCVYEIKSDGSKGTPKILNCGSSASTSKYSLTSSGTYSFNFDTGYGSRRYRMDVYCYPDHNGKPQLLGSKEFYAR